MKPRNVKPKSRSLSSGPQKQAKRSISVKGKWKAVELDPCLFSEEGLEGLVCFEELTNYKLVDPEKAATKATKELKKKEERKKKKAKKRKASEEEQAEGCPAVESKEGGETSEPAKKKAKKKKKNKKQSAKEAVQQDNISAEVTEKEVAAEEEKREGETAEDDSRQNTLSNKVQKITKKQKQQIENAADVEPTLELKALEKVEAQKINKKQKQKQQIESAAGVEPTLELKALEKVEAQQINKKQKKKQKQQIKNAADVEPSLELQALGKVKSSEDNVAVPRKKKQQIKNWTHAALTGSVKNTDVSAWKDLFVPSPVLKALSNLGFGSPTPVQALALPPAIRDRMDILGAAETGSGKTLAFGIPMIHTILEWKKGSGKPVEDKNESPTNVESLYLPALKPELTAESISEEDEEVNMEAVEEGAEDVDQGVSEDNSEDDEDMGEDEDEKLGCVQVIDDAEFDFDDDAAAEEKLAEGQNQPLLGLVLTPTRELAVQVKHHIDAVAKFTDIKTVIVVGGMSAEKQRKMLKRRPEIVIATPGRLWDLIKERNPHLLNLRQLRCLVIDEADRMVERGHFAELDNLLEMLNTDSFNPIRQKFVFSATLTMAHTLPTRLLQKKKKHLDQRSKLEILMAKVGIKTKPKVIDLTRKDATVETLTETQLHCQKEEKDFYLYYFLLQYPGRTMVFANSIDCIKRLNSLLVILDCTPLPLHANMHQKQRLKNLERFAERESCVLLTTDVAARGLDIPDVQHVIHYQVPRTSETYVHRSGRTARANKEGLSLLLVGPDDLINFRKIHNTLGKDEELPIFPIESKCMDAIKERVNLARKIEKIEYHNSREKQHNSWFKQAAEALEVDLDDDVLIGRGSDEDTDREQRQMVQGMKRHLKHLISQPVFKNAIKTKYPTQMGKLSLPHLPRAGMESALTRVTMEQKKKLKLKKNVPTQQQKKQQQ